MEKLATSANAKFPLQHDRPFFDALQVSFEPVELRRPLKLFGSALGLSVGVAREPDLDFLAHLIDGIGHQTSIRAAAGGNFKNFENFVRRRNATRPQTKQALWKQLGMDELTLDLMQHGEEKGPLVPKYLEVFGALEGMFLRTFGSATIGVCNCPHCGGDLLDDDTRWWQAQQFLLTPGAASFVDRLLKVMLGAATFVSILSAGTRITLDHLIRLSDPETHPVGNWMSLAISVRGLGHDWELTVGIDSEGNGYGPEADGRLRKWRCGQELLPMSNALRMINDPNPDSLLKQALLAARLLAMAIDLVQSAAEGSSYSRRAAQNLVTDRLHHLTRNLRKGLTAISKKSTALT